MKFSDFRKLKGPVMLRRRVPEDKERTYYIHHRHLTEIAPNEDGTVTVRERAWVGINVREDGNEFELHMVDETYALDPILSIDRRVVTEANVMSVLKGKQSIIKDMFS